MRKLVAVLIALTLALGVLPGVAFAHRASDPYSTDLIAGGGNPKSAIDAGDVLVWNDADTLYVKYVTEGDWCLAETLLAVGDELSDIPQTRKGSPIPGQFPYSEQHDCVTEYTYEIPLEWDFDAELFIAAHAVVIQTDYDGNVVAEETGWGAGPEFPWKDWATYFNYTVQNEVCGTVLAPIDGQQVVIAQTLYSDLGDLNISGTVWIMVKYPVPGGSAYFPKIYIDVDKDGEWDYIYEAWCVDTQNTINQNTTYEARVYNCGDDLTGVVDNPDNKPIVDYILSQDYVGKESGCDGTSYTYGDVQRAIWTVIDDGNSTAGLGSYSPCRVDEILDDAGYTE